ncbi:MAG: CPBP family intramembrane metalloprotease [Chloroflexota bacterium]|nr:CPBP family intramembrane metalloprotease [Chloroflexota bacterium]
MNMKNVILVHKAGPRIARSEGVSEQHSLIQSLVLHLFPGLCVLAFGFLATHFVIQAGFPGTLALLLSALLIGTPLRLGYLLYQGKKQHGVFSLQGIVLYWGRMPWWQYLLILLPIMVYAIALEVLLSPVNSFPLTHMFWWLPPALLPSGAVTSLTTATLITALLAVLIDGIVVPVVEEVYYRGYLLPRLSRLGWLAPVVNVLLFTLGHFWQPYNYLLIFLLVLPEVYLVYWKRNIKISILIHCTANTLGAVLTLVALFMTR